MTNNIEMTQAIGLVRLLADKHPAIVEAKEWKILRQMFAQNSQQFDYLVAQATAVVEWQEKPCKLLVVSDERILLDELYEAFNNSIPMWAVAIITKDDIRPSDLPARQAREQLNAGIIERNMDKPNHG